MCYKISPTKFNNIVPMKLMCYKSPSTKFNNIVPVKLIYPSDAIARELCFIIQMTQWLCPCETIRRIQTLFDDFRGLPSSSHKT